MFCGRLEKSWIVFTAVGSHLDRTNAPRATLHARKGHQKPHRVVRSIKTAGIDTVTSVRSVSPIPITHRRTPVAASEATVSKTPMKWGATLDCRSSPEPYLKRKRRAFSLRSLS